jgi:outer membrane protein assembly factor BamB
MRNDMMKSLIWVLFPATVMGLFACTKEISKDLPLPLEREESVFINTENGNLMCFEANTGRKKWEVVMRGGTDGVPVFHNKKIFQVTADGYMYTIDPIRGKIDRETQINRLNPSNSLCVNANMVYFAEDSLYAYDTLHNKMWAFKEANEPSFSSSPKYLNDKIYVSAGPNLYCMNSSGSVSWKYVAIDAINSSVSISNGLVYFGCDDGKVYALDASNGSVKWSYVTGDNVYSSPAVYGGMCLVGSDDYYIYSIDTTTGLERWKFKTNERIKSSPAIHEFTKAVIVGGYDFNLYAVSHVTGELLWKYPSASIILSSPVVYGNYVYFTSFDRYLYALDARDGRIVWKQFLNANTKSSPLVDDTKKPIYPGISGHSLY